MSFPPTARHTSRAASSLVLMLATGCGGGSEREAPRSSAGGSPSGGAAVGAAPTVGGAAGAMSSGSSGSAGSSPAAGGSLASTGGTAGSAGGSSGAEGGVAGGAGLAGSGGEAAPYVPISFGTKLDPAAQVAESRRLAQSLAEPGSPAWRAKGDQRRTYRFDEANADVAFRVCVPPTWDGTSKLPLVMFLHGASNDESSYLDQNGKQMVKLAEQHGYVLVSPLGHGSAYGNFLRLPADFGKPEEAVKLLAMRTEEAERTQQLSEKDVINVLEMVLHEYPIEQTRMFLMGHSMGSGGTWYIGGKYAAYWAALAPMSGPFVLEQGYPWDSLRNKPVLVTEGLSAATVAGSRAVRDWMMTQGFPVSYEEVNADHPGMVPLVLPGVFAFFDAVR